MPKMYRSRWIRAARDADPEEPSSGGGGKPEEKQEPEAKPEDDKDWVPSKEGFLSVKAEKQRLKEALDAANKKIQEHEDSKLSEKDKLAKENSETKEKLTSTERRALQLEVALEKGLTLKQATRLVGNTRDELEADADELRETFGGPAARVSTKPRKELRGGGEPDEDDGAGDDPAKLAAAVRAKAGYGR
jgi:hypothetical protein